MNTMSLVNHARDVVDARPDEYDEIWLVFDKDSFDRECVASYEATEAAKAAFRLMRLRPPAIWSDSQF